MNTTDFEFTLQRIRANYTDPHHTDFDTLKALDRAVKRPPCVFAWCFGSLGSLVMGFGMSLTMTDIGAFLGITEPMISGIAIGIFGIAMTLLCYPIYRKWLHLRRKRYAAQILDLSERMLRSEG